MPVASTPQAHVHFVHSTPGAASTIPDTQAPVTPQATGTVEGDPFVVASSSAQVSTLFLFNL